jgi:hypothetical protein
MTKLASRHGYFTPGKELSTQTVDKRMGEPQSWPGRGGEQKNVNVYLPSLMMKVPNHLYVLGDTYK